jgi:hypothetical protein
MLIPCLMFSSVLLFTILGVKTRSGIVVVGVCFGFGSGACEFLDFVSFYLFWWI